MLLQWMFFTSVIVFLIFLFFPFFACIWRILDACKIVIWFVFIPLPFYSTCPFSLSLSSVKSVTDPPSWHQPGSPERKRVPREILRGLNSSPTHTTSTPFHQRGYVRTWRSSKCSVTDSNWASFRLTCVVLCVQAKLMSECSGSINTVKRVKLILNDEEELEDPGLTSSTADKQTSTGTDRDNKHWEVSLCLNLSVLSFSVS